MYTNDALFTTVLLHCQLQSAWININLNNITNNVSYTHQ